MGMPPELRFQRKEWWMHFGRNQCLFGDQFGMYLLIAIKRWFLRVYFCVETQKKLKNRRGTIVLPVAYKLHEPVYAELKDTMDIVTEEGSVNMNKSKILLDLRK
jgi:hypothetical protein